LLDLIYPPLLPCCVSSLHSEATTPQPRPPSHCATQIVRDDPLSPPAEPFVPMSLRAICRGFGPDPAQLARSACPAIAFGDGGQPRLSACRRIAPSGKIASGPRIRAKSFVSLRTEPGFCGPHQSCSPLHEQNSSSLRSSQDCPFRPFIVTLQRNRTQKTPAGSDSYCAPFPLRNKSRTPLPWEKPSSNPGRDPGGPGNRPLLPTGYYPGHAPACPPAWSAPGNLSHSKLKTLLPKTPAATNRSGLLSGSHPATAA